MVLLGLLTIPLYWGSAATRELYDNFYYIWAKLKNGDEETKDAEWKRRFITNKFSSIFSCASCPHTASQTKPDYNLY